MKTGVITFPGSNCDDDLVFALRNVCGFQVENLWHKDHIDLSSFDLIGLPGGFSFGDYLRCGAIAALSPIMEDVINFAESGGLVLGICNGFQILCEVGLLPGALAKNENLNFVCKDIMVRVNNTDSPWTSAITGGEVLQIPIAHGDGRFVMGGEEYSELKNSDQILLSYCDANGNRTPLSNPNGSSFSIAGICNDKKNVFGLMPHPERASDLRSLHGMKIWESLKLCSGKRKAKKGLT